MFEQDVGTALIDKDHPVGKEYEWPVGNAQIQFFPMQGAQGETIVKAEQDSASVKSWSRLQPALRRTLGPHPRPPHQDGLICSRQRQHSQGRLRHEDASFRRRRRRRSDS